VLRIFEVQMSERTRCRRVSCASLGSAIDRKVSSSNLLRKGADISRDFAFFWHEVRPSTVPGAGSGAFTLIDLPEGVVVGMYCGKEVSPHEASVIEDTRYLLELIDEDGEEEEEVVTIIDGSDARFTDWTRYINDCFGCDLGEAGYHPNIMASFFGVEENGGGCDEAVRRTRGVFRRPNVKFNADGTIETIGPIAKGEELFIDYGTHYRWK